MNQDGRSPSGRRHPPWCALSDDDHDPHESARYRVQDPASLTIVDAFLTQLDHPATPDPLVTIELHYPGDEPNGYLLTVTQLHDLERAFTGLRTTATGSD